MNELAGAWSDCLDKAHREALQSALDILTDEFFENDLEDPENIFRELLPQKYLLRYTPGFLTKFFAAFLTVGYKLALPEASETLIACTAEELALRILVDHAETLLESDGIKPDFGLFLDLALQDSDYEYLYQPEMDGIEDSEQGRDMGIGNLHFSEWFKPFDNASMPVHPLCWEEETGETNTSP